MPRLTGLIAVTLVAFSVPPCLFAQHHTTGTAHHSTADRAHQLASKAASQHPAKCKAGGVGTLQKCRTQFPDGCSQARNPSYDAYLDFLKDQRPATSVTSTKDLGESDFPDLESKLPPTLTEKNHAHLATTFAGLGEGNIYTVIAYLYFAVDTGKATATRSPNSETCNCKLTAANTFDYHLGIGFDSTLAASAKTQPPESDPAYVALEKASVVAEMTPFIRAKHPQWTIARVKALEGQQIKVVGQLMADNVHFNKNDDCAFTGAQPSCWRSTIWEIHPITKFFVCKNASGCSASSPASDWTNLDSMP